MTQPGSTPHRDAEFESRRARTSGLAGTMLLLLGTAGLLCAALVQFDALPPGLLRWWLRSESLLLLLSIIALLAGGRLLWNSGHAPAGWSPQAASSSRGRGSKRAIRIRRGCVAAAVRVKAARRSSRPARRSRRGGGNWTPARPARGGRRNRA